MSWQIIYRHRYTVDPKKPGVTLPVSLFANDRVETTEAAIDTGSTLCVFKREIAEWLDIAVEKGIEDHVNAMGTVIRVYGHEVRLVIGEMTMDLLVYFPAFQNIPRNLLGRQGFLQRMLFGLDDYEGVVYFGYHSDQ